MQSTECVSLHPELINRFTIAVKEKFPKKAFGYFLAPIGDTCPSDFIIFNDDIRNDWRELFEQYGNYYKRNQDAGFLTTPEETYSIEKYIRNNGLRKIGVFHSHQRHPAIFSKVDVDLHPDESLWHLIISLRNFDLPQIKIFALKNSVIKELKIVEK